MNIQLLCLPMLLSLTASWSLAQETSLGQEKKSDSPAATEKKAGAPKEEKPIPLLVQIVRLAPGETKELEIELPGGQFRPGTRDLCYVESIPKKFSKEASTSTILNGVGYFQVAEGVKMRWHKAGVTIQASSDAVASSHNLRVRFQSFLDGYHYIGLRVVIEPK